MKALAIAGCVVLLVMGLAPAQAEAGRSGHGHHSSVYVDVQIGGYGGGYYGGPVICHPPRPVYHPAPVYCPPPVRYYAPPVVYHRPVYHPQPVYRGHYHSGYRGGYSRSCDW